MSRPPPPPAQTGPSPAPRPMRPALIRHRARSEYAMTSVVGLLRPGGAQGLVLEVSRHDLRPVTPGDTPYPPLPARVRAQLRPVTGARGEVRWTLVSAAPTTDPPRRSTVYISGRVARVTPTTVTVEVSSEEAQSRVTVWASSRAFPDRPESGERMLIHAHVRSGQLVAHHLIPVPPHPPRATTVAGS